MLARIAGINGNGARDSHLFFKFLLGYSTRTSSTNYLVEFLVDSLGFSSVEAVTASNKVTRLKPSNNPKLVVSFFRQSGFDNTQIKNIVYKIPKILFSDVDKTLEPKLNIFQEYGLSGTEVVNFVAENYYVLCRGVDTFIRPSLDYLRNLLGSDENVAKALKKAHWLFFCNFPKIMAPNVLLLQGIGFSDVKIRKFILLNPRFILQNHVWFKDVVCRVEKDLGIPRESNMFLYGINAISVISRSSFAKKVEIFRGFGWSDAHIKTMTRHLPLCLGLSEEKIRKKLGFLMKEVGCTPEYLASRPKLIMYSLEKRVIPRYRVLKILSDEHLRSSVGLYSAVTMTPSTFMKELLLPYKDKVPLLYESYMKSVQ